MLKNRPIPLLSDEQVQLVTQKSIHAKREGEFFPDHVIRRLNTIDHPVLAMDIGGDKIIAAEYSSIGTSVKPDEEIHKIQSERNNAGYLQFLETLAKQYTLPVGVSIAGPVNGTVAEGSPSTKSFIQDFDKQYGRDFINIFRNQPLTVLNDGAAGLTASIIEALRQKSEIQHVLYIIIGSGFGGAIFTNNILYSTELGHVPVVSALNPFHQEKPCGMFENTFPCVEEIVGGKAGIEALWEKETGEALGGRQIRQKLIEKNPLAQELYDLSAITAVHTIIGVLQAFQILSDLQHTTIVCEGGIFQGDEYSDRFEQLFGNYLGEPCHIIFTKNFTTNACLDGAAIAALTM